MTELIKNIDIRANTNLRWHMLENPSDNCKVIIMVINDVVVNFKITDPQVISKSIEYKIAHYNNGNFISNDGIEKYVVAWSDFPLIEIRQCELDFTKVKVE